MKAIWTYPVIHTEDSSKVAYSFGGCVDKFCWKKDREDTVVDQCEFYSKEANEEYCGRDYSK